MTKDLHHFWIISISESYEVSNFHQKGASFEFLAPILTENKTVPKSTGLHAIFRKIAILFGLSKECSVKFYTI